MVSESTQQLAGTGVPPGPVGAAREAPRCEVTPPHVTQTTTENVRLQAQVFPQHGPVLGRGYDGKRTSRNVQ